MSDDRVTHPPTTEHNYAAPAMALALAGPQGHAHDVAVHHDDWCDAYVSRGEGFCNCAPVLVVTCLAPGTCARQRVGVVVEE